MNAAQLSHLCVATRCYTDGYTDRERKQTCTVIFLLLLMQIPIDHYIPGKDTVS